MRGGRARWTIENATCNTLQNQGYHFEQNYGHGEQNLAVGFATLMRLAFLVDQAQQLCCALFQMEDKLLFILFYCKVYPLQEVMAFLFDTSQGRVNEWIHQRSIVLQMALGKAQALPERDPNNLEQTLALCVSVDFIIDGTERRVHRPQDATEQQEKYSGKKRPYREK